MNDIHDLVKLVKKLHKENDQVPNRDEFIKEGVTDYQIRKAGGYFKILSAAGLESRHFANLKRTKLKILVVDIETAPLLVRAWSLWDQHTSLNQVVSDWFILAWAAKWLGEKEVFYRDLRGVKIGKNIKDKSILQPLWDLMDQADVIVSQNGKSFDTKKIFARFIINQMPPPSSFRQEDTKEIAKQVFGFTSNKLEYMTETLNKKYKKLHHKKFPGQELWNECLKGNPAAWKEMEKYNKHDILSTEELYISLRAWRTSINVNTPSDYEETLCSCGSDSFIKAGFKYSNLGKYVRYKCSKCGAEQVSRENLLSKDKKKSLKKVT